MAYGITPIHLIGIAVSMVLMYQSVRLVRKQKESIFEFLLWSGFGLGIFILSLGQLLTISGILDSLNIMLGVLGFETGTNGIFTLSILGLLLLLFYTYVNAKTNRQKIADLNQELSILEYQLKQSERTQQNEAHKANESGDD